MRPPGPSWTAGDVLPPPVPPATLPRSVTPPDTLAGVHQPPQWPATARAQWAVKPIGRLDSVPAQNPDSFPRAIPTPADQGALLSGAAICTMTIAGNATKSGFSDRFRHSTLDAATIFSRAPHARIHSAVSKEFTLNIGRFEAILFESLWTSWLRSCIGTERMAAFLRSSAASTLFPLQGDDGVETCRLIGGLEAEEDADHG